MSNIPRDLRYTKSHEWLRALPDGRVQVGITDHAQAALGDLVFVDVPLAGRTVAAGDAFAVVESVKAASDVYSPLPGKIIEGNARLADAPELLNQDPYGEGWLMMLQPESNTAQGEFLSAAEYQAFLDSESA